MATKIEARLPRGMRDIVPQKMLLRRYVIGVLEQVFEQFGFEPLQTPALELTETLMGKYGPDADKLIYEARHVEGKEQLSLRYDLTVPLTRVVATYPDLVKPFKRYQIAPVWRAERPQKGRYREFYQCDVDIVGSASLLADAEIIAVIYAVLTRLGFRQFVTKLNNRKLLTALGEYAGVPPTLRGGLYRSIDKLDKIGVAGVREEMSKSQIPTGSAQKILALLDAGVADMRTLRARVGDVPAVREGIDELEQVVNFALELGVAAENIQIDFAMVRGLEYYTGPIYETVVTAPKIGSLTGGGRYDELLGLFTNQSLPATGTSFGIERIIDVMDELKMYPRNLGRTVTQVLVTVFDAARRADSLRVTRELRAAGLNVEVWYEADGLGKQLKYAAAKGIPFAVIIGPDEASANNATLRDLATGEQKTFSQRELAKGVRQKFETPPGQGQ